MVQKIKIAKTKIKIRTRENLLAIIKMEKADFFLRLKRKRQHLF